MVIVLLLVFICLTLAAGALLCFGYSLRSGDHEHAERLSLMPLETELPFAEGSEPRAPGASDEESNALALDRVRPSPNPSPSLRSGEEGIRPESEVLSAVQDEAQSRDACDEKRSIALGRVRPSPNPSPSLRSGEGSLRPESKLPPTIQGEAHPRGASAEQRSLAPDHVRPSPDASPSLRSPESSASMPRNLSDNPAGPREEKPQ